MKMSKRHRTKARHKALNAIRMDGHAINIAEVKERYGDWDRFIALCDEVTGFTGDEKENARRAFQHLRTVLGEGFLKRAIEQGHPIFSILLNNTRVTRLQLTRFANALVALSFAQGYDEILRRIKKPGQFVEGASVLNTAYQFFRAGFKVSFEPSVIVTLQDGRKVRKNPDLSVLDEETGEEVIVEVSALEESAGHKQAFDDSSFVIPLLFRVLGPARLTMYAQMSDTFDSACVNETVKQLEELADEVTRTGKFGALINDHIEAGIAPDDNAEQLKRWAAERRISPGIGGPPIRSNEVARAITKIRDKLAQLPEDRPGIIVIPSTASMLFHRYDMQQIIDVLGEEVSRYSKLWAVILSHSYWGGERSSITTASLGQHAVMNKTLAEALQEQAVILVNEACSLLVTAATQEKIKLAFAEA